MNTYCWVVLGLIINLFLFDKIPVFRYLLTPIAGLTLAIISPPMALLGMSLFAKLIKWDTVPSFGSYPTDLRIKYNCIVRGDMPKGLGWLQPIDDRWPGPMYEPEMERIYLKYGRTWASWYNGAIRNQMFGLAAAMGKPTTDFIEPEVESGFWQRDGIWVYALPISSISIVMGWQVYRKLDQTFLAVPVLTIKRKKLVKQV